jgi:IclR family transcriptional regulator, KDG regulon repressor
LVTDELIAVRENGKASEVANAPLRSAGNMLTVLGCFSVQRPSWTLTELSRHVGLGKSTIFRILATLEAHQFLMRDVEGYYRPTMRMWEIGAAALVVNGLQGASRRFLPRLSERTGETAYCTILDGQDAVHIDVYVAKNPVRLHADIGDRFPAHTVASGKVLLAALPEEAVETYIRGGLPAYTDRTLTDPTAFRQELEQVSHQGFAINRGERQSYVVGAAAPVHDHTGEVIAAIAAAGPSIRVTDDLLAVGRIVREVADEMSFSLGCPPLVLEAHVPFEPV